MHKRFEAHGSFSARLNDRIMTIEGTGPWNLEALFLSRKLFQPYLDELKGDTFGVLLIVYGECIFVPSAAKELSTLVQEGHSLGRLGTAILVNASDSPRFAKLHLAEIYESANENHAFFDDIDLAKAWLTRLLVASPHKNN